MKYSIGIDIGGTNTEIGLVDKKGELISQNKFSTQAFNQTSEYIDCIVKLINELLESSNINLDDVKGIGIGAPNGNFKTGKIENPPNLFLDSEICIVEDLKKYFSFPIILTNDAKAAAIGEKIYGGAKLMDDYIMITLGTGVGCGIVANGQLIYGKTGMAGEFGHCTFEYNGRACTCGKTGCLEAYAAIRGIKQTYKNLCEKYSLQIKDFESLDIKQIAEQAKKKELAALETFKFTAEVLGKKLASLGEIFSPDCIFLAGGISKTGEFFLNDIYENFEKNLLTIYKNTIKIELSHIDKNVGIMGASSLVWN